MRGRAPADTRMFKGNALPRLCPYTSSPAHARSWIFNSLSSFPRTEKYLPRVKCRMYAAFGFDRFDGVSRGSFVLLGYFLLASLAAAFFFVSFFVFFVLPRRVFLELLFFSRFFRFVTPDGCSRVILQPGQVKCSKYFNARGFHFFMLARFGGLFGYLR